MIPKIIHQLWKTHQVPIEHQKWQLSWKKFNPEFEYKLWSNEDIENLLSDYFPEWEEIFYKYPENINRIDFARYLILKKYGGIYADLDFECLRTQNHLIENKSFVVGIEPLSHCNLKQAKELGMQTPIVCNAWMASEAEHPFWNHFFEYLKKHTNASNVLEVTGSFALTRALETYPSKNLTILPPDVLYPIDKISCWNGRFQDLEFFARSTQDAYAVHYWEGSWFKTKDSIHDFKIPNIRARQFNKKQNIDQNTPTLSQNKLPLISCLMVTRGKPNFLRQAINGFLAQTYVHKELIIVTEKAPELLAFFRSEYKNHRIFWNFIDPSQSLTLGQLRNISIDKANGEYIIQWDDDDLNDPSRLEYQFKILQESQSEACMLARWVVWWPEKRRLFLSGYRYWEGSLLCLKSIMPRYPSLSRGEDTVVTKELMANHTVVVADMPRLYTYVIHGENTWNNVHFENIYQRASVDFTHSAYGKILNKLSERIEINNYPKQNKGVKEAADSYPKILILTPMKNTSKYLERYFDLIAKIDYPKDKLSLGILEGDSTDNTAEQLRYYHNKHVSHFRKFTLLQHHTNLQIKTPRWLPEIQFIRRSALAEVRNRLLVATLKDEEWVLWLDADLEKYPETLLKEMLATNKDIVVPCCIKENGQIFDKNTFCFYPNQTFAEQPEYLRDGIFQPSSGQGRLYLDSYKDHTLVPVDSVGGTALLVKADLCRRGLIFPPYSHRGYIETEGLAAMARDMGVQCWGMPNLMVVHINN